jgi:tetratricopeptide (TPR) repeat protein
MRCAGWFAFTIATFTIAAFSIATICAGPASAQGAPPAKYCDQYIVQAPVETRLAACTAMIESGEFVGVMLADIYLMRGRIFFHLKGDRDRALADYDSALKLNPRLAAAYYYRSYVHKFAGAFDAEIADLTEAIKINPDEADLYSERGIAYIGKLDYDRALADFDTANKLDPEDQRADRMRRFLGQARKYQEEPKLDQ